jgi:hypothetical protein
MMLFTYLKLIYSLLYFTIFNKNAPSIYLGFLNFSGMPVSLTIQGCHSSDTEVQFIYKFKALKAGYYSLAIYTFLLLPISNLKACI